mgnify:FL=1
MNFQKIHKPFFRIISFFAILHHILFPLYAGISHSVNVTGDGIIDGYINLTNTITITVTFDGDDATTYNGGTVSLEIAWSESNGVPSSFNAANISDDISGGTATLTVTDDQIHGLNTSGDSYLDRFDFKLVYINAAYNTTGNINVNDWGNVDVDGQGYLTLARRWPWPNLRVWQAANWSDSNDDDETFSLQRVRIYPDIVLGSDSDYPSYIYITDTDDNQYRYQIGGVDATELESDEHIIDLTQRVKKYNTVTTNWDSHSGDVFVHGMVYDVFFTIYDIYGNKRVRTRDDFIDNRVFDGRAPTVVINGTGETFGLFGPGNDPISGNAINDTDPYYFTTDEDVTIYFDWQHDPNYLEDMYGFTSTDVKINGNSDHGLSLTGPGDDNVYSMILSGMGSVSYTHLTLPTKA